MARRKASSGEEQAAEDSGLPKLQFNEPLSWRPGKPIPTEQLHGRLSRLSKELAELDQDETDTESLTKVAKELASHHLLGHKDKGVKAFTACCIVDILRICAPNAPFSPAQLKDIFNLCITYIIPAVFDPTHSYNNEHRYVLISFSDVKSIALLADLDGNESLMLHLFLTAFDGVSAPKKPSAERVARDVEYHLLEILTVLVEEAVALPHKVVDAIMAQFLRGVAQAPGKDRSDPSSLDENQSTLLLKEEPEAYQMAKALCNACPEKMARHVSQYFSDVLLDASGMTGKANGHRAGEDSDEEELHAGPSDSDLKELRKAHQLLRELWRAAPAVLQNVVPQLDAEIAADNVHLRQLATETLGDMISGIGAAGPPLPPVLDPAAYPPLKLTDDIPENPASSVLTTPLAPQSFSQTHPSVYENFISRKNDKSATIRSSWTTAVGYILSTSGGGIGLSREEEVVLVQGLSEKLSDNDEKVRLAAVKAIENFTFRDFITKLAVAGGVQKEGSFLCNLADRCRDKKSAVRIEAMALLGKLWAVGTGELVAGNDAVVAALSGVPSRIFNVFYTNDLELNVLLDRVIFECLVPLGYPPPKKAAKSTNGSSQSQPAATLSFDQDAIRAERILLLARSLDQNAKKAFFVMQARQPQFARIMDTLVKQCEAFNGGVMDDKEKLKSGNLEKSILYVSQFLPDSAKVQSDLNKFAKANDRRNYHLIRCVIGQENDFKTVHRALKELIKRIQSSKEPVIADTILPLLYRSGCIMFNRSHLATVMDISKTDKEGLGAISHELLNEISQRIPDLFKKHLVELCKDIVDKAPSATRENDPLVVESLKACSSYAQKFPKEMNLDKKFTQTMMDYAAYCQPPKGAKYAVNILLSKKDDKSMVSATDLLQRTIKNWACGSPHFLNKLTTVSQLELLAPKVTADYEDEILNVTVQKTLLEVRTGTSDKDPDWVDDADLDEECRAKLISLKILVNRLRSTEDLEEAKEKAKPVWKLLRALIVKNGEICKTKDTPKHHRARLRLRAAQLLLKLCSQKHFDDLLSASDFNSLAFVIQDRQAEVRHGFTQKLQKYLAAGHLRSRYYTILFLAAYEPVSQFKQRIETWIRSRANRYQESGQPVLEAIMGRLLSLLAHHPDFTSDLDDLVDHARYILFYISNVATEANLGLIYKYAERVKQTQDAIDLDKSENLRVLSDLAQAVIRKWQAKRNWVFQAYGQKVGLPYGLYTALQSHAEAQEIATRQYIPDGIDAKLDELVRVIDRKKKRKSIDERPEGRPPAKKARPTAAKPAQAKPGKPAPKKAALKSKTPAKPRKSVAASSSPVASSLERRRSGRSAKNKSYIERDSSEDDEEMLEGVAEWDYFSGEENDEEGGKARKRKSARDDSDDGEPMDEDEVEPAKEDAGEHDEPEAVGEDEEATPPPTANGRRAKSGGAPKPKARPKPVTKLPARGKAAAAPPTPAPSKAPARVSRAAKKKTVDVYEMDDD